MENSDLYLPEVTHFLSRSCAAPTRLRLHGMSVLVTHMFVFYKKKVNNVLLSSCTVIRERGARETGKVKNSLALWKVMLVHLFIMHEALQEYFESNQKLPLSDSHWGILNAELRRRQSAYRIHWGPMVDDIDFFLAKYSHCIESVNKFK